MAHMLKMGMPSKVVWAGFRENIYDQVFVCYLPYLQP